MTENTFNPEATDADDVVVEQAVEAPVEEALASVVEEAVAEELAVVEEPVIEEVVPEPTVIVAPEPVEAAPAITAVDGGVIGTGKVAKKAAAPKVAKPASNVEEKVALLASRSVHWLGLGKLQKGYNIVSKQDAEQWVTLPTVRLATPEEIKTFLG